MNPENPYRYEGTSESLQAAPVLSSVRARGTLGICFKSFLVTLLTSIVTGQIVDPDAVGVVVLFALVLLLPITAFGVVFRNTHKIGKAQIAYWLAAAPVAMIFGSLILNHDPGQNIARLIGVTGLLGYSILLVPTALALLFFAASSKLTPDW